MENKSYLEKDGANEWLAIIRSNSIRSSIVLEKSDHHYLYVDYTFIIDF